MSGKSGGKPRKHPGIKGVRPDRKEAKRAEAKERRDWRAANPKPAVRW